MSERRYPTGEALTSLEEFNRMNGLRYSIAIDEGQRQMLLSALAALSYERPGFDGALWEIARLCDEKDRADSMYERFLELRRAT